MKDSGRPVGALSDYETTGKKSALVERYRTVVELCERHGIRPGGKRVQGSASELTLETICKEAGFTNTTAFKNVRKIATGAIPEVMELLEHCSVDAVLKIAQYPQAVQAEAYDKAVQFRKKRNYAWLVQTIQLLCEDIVEVAAPSVEVEQKASKRPRRRILVGDTSGLYKKKGEIEVKS
jgi:hypothetical protein